MKSKCYWINGKRNSRIEGLRCIAMLLIVMSHSSVHGVFPAVASDFMLNRYFLDWMTLGNLGTDIFVILSGWNLFGKVFKARSVVKLLIQVWTISILGLCIYACTGNAVSTEQIFRSIIPVLSDSWWFATTYIVLLLLTPYINIFIENVSRKQFEQCLMTMLILWCFIPMVSTQDMSGGKLAQMIMLYSIGAYLKKYPDNVFRNKKHAVFVLVVSMGLMLLSAATIRWINSNIVSLPFEPDMLYSRTSILVIACAVAMVVLSVYATPYQNKVVNTLGASTFGIYLLHEHPLIKDILWTEWLNNAVYYQSSFFVIVVMISVTVVFVVCGFVEWLRLVFLAKPLERLAGKTIDTMCGRFRCFGGIKP